MRLLPSVSRTASALTHALCLVVASALAGCATKNPLMEEPTTTANSVAKAPSPAAASQAGSAQPLPAAAGPVQEAGVQTSKERRLFGILSPYRIDVQQGNFVSQEMLNQLKTGMTPEQVRFVLGTPLLTDIFHANRWDYVFRLEKGTGEIINSRIVVHFKDNRVAKVDAGQLPSEEDYLALIAGPKQTKK